MTKRIQPTAPVAWEVEINYLSCVVFAPTKAKAKWLAVRSYWDACGRSNRSWPHVSIARRPELDRVFPGLLDPRPRAYCPDFIRGLAPLVGVS